MDIETFIKDGIHIPYAISWYDGEKVFSYYLSDFTSYENMLKKALNDLMVKKYDNYRIYIHNLANFDAIFLLKILAKIAICKPIIHNDRIISIQLNYGDHVIYFRDSLQILIGSLAKLGKSFKVETVKSIFPYLFVNENNLDYIGNIPEINFFDDVSNSEYLEYCNNYKNKLWNMKDETIKYCNIDCISLYQIISKFNELIFNLFKINLHKYPTLTSLSFAIFRAHFMKEETIPQLSGQIAKDIRMSYTGGACDMYIPKAEKDTTIYAYDVNSLYPSVMRNNAMPIGNPTFFKGDIRKIDFKAFGFFFCNITAPENLLHPIIQTHVKTNNGIRTIAPLGQWTDMIFSAEMDNAIELGYKFEILWGYTFEKANIFKEFVDTFYNIRLQYPKTDLMNYVAKLILNSVYGRMGMNDSFAEITIFANKDLYQKFENEHSSDIIDIIELGEQILVKHRSNKTDAKTMLDNASETHNTNIAIASAITGYARIHMSQFKNNPDFNLFYTDTDSVYIDKPLSEEYVSNKELGKMKLENICKKAIFLSPKVYFLLNNDGKVIYKVKGLSHDVKMTFTDFDSLLTKDAFIKKAQTKWMKNLSEGHITILKQLYTLKVTDNKRKLLYGNAKLMDSKPYIIDMDKKIIN
jgi:DNA polymerase elongation subunit (family B)